MLLTNLLARRPGPRRSCRQRQTNRQRHRVPWAQWPFLLSVLAAALSALTLHTYAARGEAFGNQVPLRAAQAALGHRVPVVRAEDSRSASPWAGGRSRPVALVVTGGPDPYETPRLLAAMRRRHVTGTFLVVGAKVNAHPELAREILAQGSRLVPYTFTGGDPDSLPPWRRTAELSLTRHSIEAATGREASPSGTASSAVGTAVVLRDDGGSRPQADQVLGRLVTSLAAHGHRVTTQPGAPGARADLLGRMRGTALREAQRAGAWVPRLLTWSAIAIIVLEVVQTLVLVTGAAVYRRRVRARQARRNTRAPVATPVTVVVPAFNEAAGIEATVRSLAASTYPQLDIVVVDDGSTDGTADIVEHLGLPGVRVIRQHNTGKPGALNTGISHASHPLVVMTDGDTVFEPETITRVVQPFADPAVGAVSGNSKVANRGGPAGRYQHTEYVGGFNLERRLFDVAECMPTVPGPIAAFRREVLTAVGGVPDDTLAEDTDLTMAVCRAGWRVVYEPDAVVWTEAPWQTGQLWRQRYRWAFGTYQAMWKHRRALVDSGASGRFGRRGLMYLLVFRVVYPLLSPVADVAMLHSLLFSGPGLVTTFLLAYLGGRLCTTGYALRRDGEGLRDLWALLLHLFCFRPLLYLVSIQAMAAAVEGVPLPWHQTGRKGAAATMTDRPPSSSGTLAHSSQISP